MIWEYNMRGWLEQEIRIEKVTIILLHFSHPGFGERELFAAGWSGWLVRLAGRRGYVLSVGLGGVP